MAKRKTGGIAADRLLRFIERIENLEEEKAGLASDIKEVKAEAKAAGFDVPTMMKVIKLRKLDPADRAEAQQLLELYCDAVGVWDATPLGAAAGGRSAEDPAQGEA